MAACVRSGVEVARIGKFVMLGVAVFDKSNKSEAEVGGIVDGAGKTRMGSDGLVHPTNTNPASKTKAVQRASVVFISISFGSVN